MKKAMGWFFWGGLAWLAVKQPDNAVKLVKGFAGGVVALWSGLAHLIGMF